MSHAATNWAISQRGLKPATKIVLWHLCDRYNPDEGCFPSQERLAYDCELSRSALNEHLKILEQKGLVRRDQQINERTRQQENTRYRFAFETDFQPAQDVGVPRPESGHGAESGKSQKPSPENARSRVQNPDTNPVREPVNEPLGRAGARGGEDFDILWSGWPEDARPDSRVTAAKAFAKLSIDHRAIAIAAAEAYRTTMRLRKKPAHMIPFLAKHLFLDFHEAPHIDFDGHFVITPERPEWRHWLGSIRSKYGEAGVQTSIRHRKIVRETRWPPDLPLANRVTNLAPFVTETGASAGRQ